MADDERKCIEAVYAYEAVLTAKNGRRIRASFSAETVERSIERTTESARREPTRARDADFGIAWRFPAP
jgi:hypothetical protein